MTEGPIPYTAVVEWMRINDVTGSQMKRGIRLLREMDRAYLDYLAKKRERDRKTTGATGSGGP